jgi:hypothetical protein
MGEERPEELLAHDERGARATDRRRGVERARVSTSEHEAMAQGGEPRAWGRAPHGCVVVSENVGARSRRLENVRAAQTVGDADEKHGSRAWSCVTEKASAREDRLAVIRRTRIVST